MKFLDVIIAMVAIVGTCSARQRFETQPEYVEVNPRDRVVLQCTIFSKAPETECYWQKDGDAIRMQVSQI